MERNIRVLIVDDEVMIRKGIRMSIDWEPLGIEIVGDAKNGREALQLAEQLNPDIVLTDIRMPVMDGLELADQLKDKLPKAKVVIVSGYDDFQYARRALQIGVQEYMTKPVGADELMDIMNRLSEQIRQERKQLNDEWSKAMLLRENLPLIRGKWLSQLLGGEIRSEELIRERADQLGIPLQGPEFAVLAVEIDDFRLMTEHASEKEKELTQFAVRNIAEEVYGSVFPCVVCGTDYEWTAVLLNIDMHNKHRIVERCEELQRCVKRFVKLSVTVGVGGIVDRQGGLKQSGDQAAAALQSKVYLGKGQIIRYDKREHADVKPPALVPSEEEKELLQKLTAMDAPAIRAQLAALFGRFVQAGTSYPHLQTACVKLIVLAATHMEQMGIKPEQADADASMLNPYDEIQRYETAGDMLVWLTGVFDRFVEMMSRYKNSRYKNIVTVAIQYVHEHYAEEVRLEDISAHVYVTPNYFSRVFSQETGEHFTEWLNKYRVDKAKALLKDIRLKVYEVAEKVGYNDYKYFTHLFKKYTGLTPKQYRNQL